MSQTMEDLAENQNQIMVAMNQFLVTFKKTGHERRTPDYVKRRLETLDAYWQEFQMNHVTLSGFKDESLEYFAKNRYQQTKEFYISTHEYIKQATTSSVLRPATPLAGTSVGVSVEQHTKDTADTEIKSLPAAPMFRSQGTNSKLDDWMKKQTSNFKAFSRAIRNINIDSIRERWEFQDTLKSLEARWSAIDSLHWELDGELDGKDQSYEDAYSAYETAFNCMKKKLNSKLCHATSIP
ncbi:unnamed protein product [Arctia plantaginis]|uniref:Uncharacterized protein n=1 Tax=Arctia plantaginis TaxID=874455 RepID=A0A8S1A4A9_ARCPL|nr:unnamed protein product [Arctia plantaginis]